MQRTHGSNKGTAVQSHTGPIDEDDLQVRIAIDRVIQVQNSSQKDAKPSDPSRQRIANQDRIHSKTPNKDAKLRYKDEKAEEPMIIQTFCQAQRLEGIHYILNWNMYGLEDDTVE